ncbi:MAG: hypothetical protein IJT70_04640 [Clostridia bacterium]|nr:hypothetical protein [Clostridia bacterium]
MSKKGLLIVYNAHNLLEFIWYYCTDKEARDIEWDALCLPSGVKGEYMSPYCEKSGIFSNIYKDNKAFSDESAIKQLPLFAKMLGYFIVGKRKSLCRKKLNEYVDADRYDIIAVLSDFGILSGMAIGLGKETVILEDGTADYRIRSNKNILKFLTSSFSWKGFILSKLGYANTAYIYPLKTTSGCVKYCSHPEMMPYKNYKEIRTLFDYSDTDREKYDSIIKSIYSEIDNCDFDSADTVLFTNNIGDFTLEPDEYIKRLENYVSKISDNTIIKKHPRDETEYAFSDKVVVQNVDQTIPAEVILPYIRGKRIIFLAASSVILYMRLSDFDLECAYFTGMAEKSAKQTTHARYLPRDEMAALFSKFGAADIRFVEI